MCVCVGFVYVWIKLNNWFETVKWSRKERGEKTTTKVDVYHVGRVGSISYDCAEIRKFRFGSQEFSVSQRLMDIFCKDAPFFWLHFSRYFCLFLSLSLSLCPCLFLSPFLSVYFFIWLLLLLLFCDLLCQQLGNYLTDLRRYQTKHE